MLLRHLSARKKLFYREENKRDDDVREFAGYLSFLVRGAQFAKRYLLGSLSIYRRIPDEPCCGRVVTAAAGNQICTTESGPAVVRCIAPTL